MGSAGATSPAFYEHWRTSEVRVVPAPNRGQSVVAVLFLDDSAAQRHVSPGLAKTDVVRRFSTQDPGLLTCQWVTGFGGRHFEQAWLLVGLRPPVCHRRTAA